MLYNQISFGGASGSAVGRASGGAGSAGGASGGANFSLANGVLGYNKDKYCGQKFNFLRS